MNPKVSIAMITYGHEPYISRALDSILAQDCDFPYEIVIGEDKSPDGTRDILRRYEASHPGVFKLILRDTNVGMTANLHDVFMHCSGEYIAYLEGDDYWTSPFKLQRQAAFLDENREYSAVSHAIEMRDVEGHSLGFLPVRRPAGGYNVDPREFLLGKTFSFSATMFRNFWKTVVDGRLRDLLVENPTGDFTMCLLFLDRGPVRVMGAAMSVYQVVREKGALNYNSLHSMLGKCVNDSVVFRSNDAYYGGKYRFGVLYRQVLVRGLIASILEGRPAAYLKLAVGMPRSAIAQHLLYLAYDLARYFLQAASRR